ncbi:aminotransferase class I/II-fold pyridoxal phosphate-dependent enzyme [Nonomuraea sp. B1E8]|uniref:aminotransferase class I/II-fold pyridoxal phosphate-dependent enzyme n=1 Tax=unclassified Nonomuraea TaxID=2593643 RepID=UPI00325C7249
MDISASVSDRTAAGIAKAFGRLITSGELPAGARLPTVRKLAQELGVSPATVSQAWQRLLRAGLVRTDGRRGTVVRTPANLTGPTRYSRLRAEGFAGLLDLSESWPDPALLPRVESVLEELSRDQRTSSYFDPPLLPGLEEVLRADWPFPPAVLTLVDGAMDAVDRLLSGLVRPGTRVVVENPTFPPILDLLELFGAEVVALPVDDRGIEPGDLGAALREADADAVILQPRGQNPTGHSMDEPRAEELAAVLRDSTALIIEDDHSAGISVSEPVSLGHHLPERTVHIRGFSKSHGPDLRMAAVGGAEGPIMSLLRRRMLGSGWTSRLLQNVLLRLLTGQEPQEQVAAARKEYAARRSALQRALTARGVTAHGRDGTNLWVGVRNEQQALVSLALNGVAVAPGSAFMATRLPGDFLRVACAPLDQHDVDGVAETIAEAAHATRRR